MMSKTSQIAFRAMIAMARIGDRRFVAIKDIAEESSLSYFFLGKIMPSLVQKGLVESYKGPKGGVRLARPPKDISLLDIIEATDGKEFKNRCIAGLSACVGPDAVPYSVPGAGSKMIISG